MEIATVEMKNADDQTMRVNVSDTEKYNERGWEVVPDSLVDPELENADELKAEETAGEATSESESTPEPEPESKPDVPPAITPDEAKKLAKAQNSELLSQFEQPEQPKSEPEDEVVMPAE